MSPWGEASAENPASRIPKFHSYFDLLRLTALESLVPRDHAMLCWNRLLISIWTCLLGLPLILIEACWNLYYYYYYYGSTVLCWTLTAFSVFDPIHSRYDSLDGGSARRKAATYTEQYKHRINAHKTSMPRVGFEPMIPAFGRAKAVYALGRAATVIGCWDLHRLLLSEAYINSLN
jgi:hypothetical protein